MQAPSQIQPADVSHQPVIVVITNPKDKTHEAYQAKASVRLGALQIIIGILCITFNVAAMVLGAFLSFLSHGIWGGVFFILAGSFGVSAGKYRTTCRIVTFMVLSIIAAVLTTLVLSFSAVGAAQDNYGHCYYNDCESQLAMDSLLIALAILEAIIAIWSSAICCGAVCCGNRSGLQTASAGQRVQYISQPGQQQIMIFNPGQQGVILGQAGFISGQAGVATSPQQYAACPRGQIPGPANKAARAIAPPPPAREDIYTSIDT